MTTQNRLSFYVIEKWNEFDWMPNPCDISGCQTILISVINGNLKYKFMANCIVCQTLSDILKEEQQQTHKQLNKRSRVHHIHM